MYENPLEHLLKATVNELYDAELAGILKVDGKDLDSLV